MRASTGQQFELTRSSGGRQSGAIITEVAAGLRSLTVDGVQLTETFPETVVPPFASGTVLVPWPNRVEDGVWLLHGVAQQLDITEPARHNALHGLLRHVPYRVAEQTADAVTLTATVFPQPGYPFLLDTSVRYQLVDDGLRVTHSILNASERPAPAAIGTHPFFRIGDVPVGELTLTVAASTHFEVDDRLNPVGEHPVDGTVFDLRAGRRLADMTLDDAFGEVAVQDGVSRHRLTAPDGRWLELWQDADFGYVQVFTTPIFPKDGGHALAVAVEPMTAPPDALNTGQGLRWLEPGERWSPSWGVRYSGRPAEPGTPTE